MEGAGLKIAFVQQILIHARITSQIRMSLPLTNLPIKGYIKTVQRSYSHESRSLRATDLWLFKSGGQPVVFYVHVRNFVSFNHLKLSCRKVIQSTDGLDAKWSAIKDNFISDVWLVVLDRERLKLMVRITGRTNNAANGCTCEVSQLFGIWPRFRTPTVHIRSVFSIICAA